MNIKPSFIHMLFAAALITSAGCASRRAAPPPNALPPAQQTSFAVNNQSSENICYVNLSPTSDSSWGTDQLGQTEVVAPGATRSWTLPVGYYDFRFQDCNHNTMMERRNVAIDATGVIVTFRVRE